MANNRITLVCIHDQERFGIAKYYPSTGWYINRGWWGLFRFGFDLKRWLDRHHHQRTMYGNDIRVEVEQVGE